MTSSEQGGGDTWAKLSGVADAFGGGGGSDPGFAYSADQLHSIAGKWERLAERYERMRDKADQLRYAEGPGAEYASQDNAMKIRQCGEALEKSLVQRAEYCRVQAEKFRAALGEYGTNEDDVGSMIKSVWGRDDDQPGGKW